MRIHIDVGCFRRRFSTALLVGSLFWLPLSAFDPPAIFLTWKEDPSRTIVIDWHTHDTGESPALEYRRRGTDEDWNTVAPRTLPFAFGPHYIHRVELGGLTPGSEVEFRWAAGGPLYYFRTMPAGLDRPVRVVFGGDTMHHREWMDRMNRLAIAENPDVIVWGGDLAYADGLGANLIRWLAWFASIKETLIGPDGRVVPIVVGIGNHEVRDGYVMYRSDYDLTDAVRAAMAPYFHTFFAFPGQPGYGVLDFGGYLSLVMLDSGHTNPIPGEQAGWLQSILAERRHVTHVVPVYHVPAFPSHRSYNEPLSWEIRQYWVPHFEEHDIAVVFENHDHAYKRTFPILRERVDATGVLYVGDGAWGVETRPVVHAPQRWYLAAAEAKRHYILAVFSESAVWFRVVDETGTEIDRFALPADEPQLSAAVQQIFPRSLSVGGGRWENDWLGRFYALEFPWIHHEQHNWIYAAGQGYGGIWLYDPAPQLQWFWTSPLVHPYLFRNDGRNWLFFDRRSGFNGSMRWFYDFSPGGNWMPVPR